MKIVQMHNRQRGIGGLNVMFDGICSLLAQRGHKVIPFERRNDQVRGLAGRVGAFFSSVYSASTKKAFSALLQSEEPDVVHVHNLYPMISPAILGTCRQFGVPVVMRCANFGLVCPTRGHFRKGAICELCCGGREYWCVLTNCRENLCESVAFALQNVVTRKLRLILDNVSCYVPNSAFVEHRLVDAGFPKDRMFVVPNVVPIPATPIDPAAGSYVAFSGRFQPEKRIETLLISAQGRHRPATSWRLYSHAPDPRRCAAWHAIPWEVGSRG